MNLYLQFEPLIQMNTSDHLHHLLIYKCDDLTNSPAATTSGVCHSIHEEASACRTNLLVAGWGVGGGVRKVLY